MNNQIITYRRRRFILVILTLCVIVGFAFYAQYQTQKSSSQSLDQNQSAQINPENLALNALNKLEIKERGSREGYKRSNFSDGWAMVDGCDTRNRILQRDLSDKVLGEDLCVVLSGTLQKDPYTNKTIFFTRGKDTSDDIQIDHVVALSDAWQKGAQALSPDERFDLANDPLNLLAVDGPTNMDKSDADASEWLPEESYRCRYVARQIAVKVKYYLWVTRSEFNAMKRVLYSCPNQELPKQESGA
ncbi:HNH endonuclease [Candidatus Saccharibacteria bacterium CPR2]|nr:HNH endonuclease [Candidatus Saccharibacteria bacterium CPR2]